MGISTFWRISVKNSASHAQVKQPQPTGNSKWNPWNTGPGDDSVLALQVVIISVESLTILNVYYRWCIGLDVAIMSEATIFGLTAFLTDWRALSPHHLPSFSAWFAEFHVLDRFNPILLTDSINFLEKFINEFSLTSFLKACSPKSSQGYFFSGSLSKLIAVRSNMNNSNGKLFVFMSFINWVRNYGLWL